MYMPHAHDPSHPIDIRKSAGVLIHDKKLLVTRSYGKDFFMAPGGKLDADETPEACLVRELNEELGIATNEKDFEDLGTYYATAGGHHDKQLEMHVFLVQTWVGDIAPKAEVAEVRWVDSVSVRGIELTSIFRDDILPLLVKKNLVV
jgi:mutator protein MutT